MIGKQLAALRNEYALKELTEASVSGDPFEQFGVWMSEAIDAGVPEPTAMTLSTVSLDGRPSARIVLLKEFSSEGFCFFTNYESRKSRELAGNPAASMHFFWPQLERQISILGNAEKMAAEESADYFRTRPVASQIGAWASKQSSEIASREVLEKWFEELEKKFNGREVPLPEFWGGFRVTPIQFEFWQGRQSRLHDRILYTKTNTVWTISRLSP